MRGFEKKRDGLLHYYAIPIEEAEQYIREKANRGTLTKEQISSIKSYLCVLARRRAIDVFRKRERAHGNLSTDDSECFIQLAADERELDEAELRREVLDAVRGLGEPDASIIIRKYYLGESSAQIADALKLTVSNVDTRTHRALNKLRKLFGGERDEKEFK